MGGVREERRAGFPPAEGRIFKRASPRSDYRVRSAITLGLGVLALATMLHAEVSPAEVDLFRRPWISQLRPSPDGRWIGSLVSTPTPGWACWSAQEPHAAPRIIPGRISEFTWLGSNSVVWVDSSQHPSSWMHLSHPGSDATPWQPPGPVDWIRILRPNPPLPDAVLLEGVPRRRNQGLLPPGRLEVFRVSKSAAMEPERLTRNPGRVITWMTDAGGQVRLALERRGTQQRVLEFPEGSQSKGRVRLALDLTQDTPRWLAVSADGSKVWFAARMGRNTRGVHELKLGSDTPSRLVFSDPDYDFEGRAVVDRDTLVALVTEERVPMTRWMDSRWSQVPDSLGFPVALLEEGRTGLFWKPGPDGGGETWIVPRPDQNRPPARLAPITGIPVTQHPAAKPLDGRTRDDLRWAGYLSMPEPDGSTRPPLAVLVHGGPWERDYAANSPEAEFLTRRGWAVLRVNYRGSDGFGRRYQELGAGHWRQAAQDLIDATRQVLDSEAIDRKRVVICGSSFGGFLAALSLTEPDTPFHATACLNAVFDLDAWLRHAPAEASSHQRRVYRSLLRGEQRPDPGSMRVDPRQIHGPLWLGHAVDDSQVPADQSRRLALSLQRLHRPVSLTLWASGGHTLGTPSNRADCWDQAERFLRSQGRR